MSTGEGLHVAIIMDGNGRWARSRGFPRTRGHREGAAAVRRVVEAAPELGIRTLTLYAFSADNWKRPRPEVNARMRLLHRYLRTEAAEEATSGGTRLHLRLAIDYSAREALVQAAELLRGSPHPVSSEDFSRALAQAVHEDGPSRDVDLLIRTSGEERLSDFLLWECAYAEFVFTPTLWPDFGEADLIQAVKAFRERERRFGALSPQAAAG